MSGFRPTRASSPSQHAVFGARAAQTSVSDISRSSAVSNSELQGLTRQDIEFLDAVIQRASPSATTFLTVFKAYNDILNERGMDPQNEVLYYGKLLKLGTLKGKSWGDKWRMVKLQQGHSGDFANHIRRNLLSATSGLQELPPTRVTTRLTAQLQEDDLFTLHSHQNDSEVVETDAGTETEVDLPLHHHTPQSALRRPPSEPVSATTNDLGPDSSSRSRSVALTSSRRQMLLPITRNSPPWDNASDVTEEVRTPSTTPPSYGAAVRDNDVYRTTPYVPRPRSHVDRPLSAQALPKPKLVPIQSQERRKSMINADDAWAKVKMLQDEKEADRFREDRLIEKCWAFWRSNFNWILVRSPSTLSYRAMFILLLADNQRANISSTGDTSPSQGHATLAKPDGVRARLIQSSVNARKQSMSMCRFRYLEIETQRKKTKGLAK
jgi:protein SFI1